MSEVAAHSRWTEQLSTRWQIPLLVVSLAGLGWGVWRLKPAPKPVSFEELYRHAVSLRDAGLYPEASSHIETLLKDPARAPEQRRLLHRTLADIIFLAEKQNFIHGKTNCERIIEHTYLSLPETATQEIEGVRDSTFHEMRALAFEWLRRGADAVEEYRHAVEFATGPHAWEMRKRMLEIRQATGHVSAKQLEAEWDAFAAASEANEALKYWAIESKISHFEENGQHEEAERFLREHAGALRAPGYQQGLDYLKALTWYHVGLLDEAERLLRSLRDTQSPGHALYARTGWLLGCVLARQEAPEPALAMFDDVITSTVPGPYRTAAWLGRAEVLARLERFEESAAGYAETLRLITNEPYDSVVDLRVVRESTTVLYETLLAQKRLAEAMNYLRVAARLVPPSDSRNQAVYAERVADLATALGQAVLATATSQPAVGSNGLAENETRRPRVSAARSEGAVVAGNEAAAATGGNAAKALFVEAGEEYLRLAQLRVLDEEAMADAVWKAADAFDLAGMRRRTTEVLENFVHEQPTTTRTPMALLRLGQTCQAAGQFQKAIAWYRQNLEEFPRTPSAVACLVPMSECFEAVGRTDLSETTLLRIVTRRPDDPMTPITPAAIEYRDALFALGSLYERTLQFEKSIARYEEALERYPEDQRTTEATYLLADVYRHSAGQLWSELTDGQHAVSRSDLRIAQRRRLERARTLYDQVIERYRKQPEASLTAKDRLYSRLSHFYRADASFDLAKSSEPMDLRALADAVDLYERAAWTYQRDPMAMSAYVQMIDCQLMLGNLEKAHMALQRARWTLRSIPDEAFMKHAPSEDRPFWEEYLKWLEKTPTLSQDVAAVVATREASEG